ncbi:SRPBCC family protein [Conyzicola sp.]|uniref:SRPBCC family protein n=1 Tax=Conyzicola sp. TaxID=1969404 RepID=UPI003988B6E3
MASESRHISVDINRPPDEVYDYTSDHTNLPTWASGIGDGIELIDDEWVVESPMGRLTIRFAEPNDLGVLDHTVTLASGETFYNPMRVIQHGTASEVLFTLRRSDDQTDDEFEHDAATIAADLHTLKALLEGENDADDIA